MIYLDNAATTKVSPEVLEAMTPYFSDVYGNPESIHSAGRKAAKAIEKAREQVAVPIGADPSNIIFTSGGSEANTLAIVGLADYLKSVGRTHIITTKVEHHSVLNAIKSLFDSGFEVTWLDVDRDGDIPPERVAEAMRENTGLVSIMAVNNEIGNRYPIERIGEICRSAGALFHTDCVQAYCGTNIDVDLSCIDFLSASGHKVHAPKGVGFLYARHKEFLRPVIHGGSQEYELRGGTHNVPYIVGLGKAAELSHAEWLHDTYAYGKKVGAIRNGVLSQLSGVYVNGTPHYNSKTLNLRFDDVDGETLLMLLDSQGVEVSAGSACSAHYAVPSHVLSAIGLTEDEARSSIRVSVSQYTTGEEIEEAIRLIIDSVNQLRGG